MAIKRTILEKIIADHHGLQIGYFLFACMECSAKAVKESEELKEWFIKYYGTENYKQLLEFMDK
jgi:hypothetical protein